MLTHNRYSQLAGILLLCGLPACEQYPFLNDNSTSTGGSGTLGLFGTSTGGSTGANSSNANSTTSPNANTPDEDALPTSGTADVAQLVCDGFIIALERDGSRDMNVYAAAEGGDFTGWTVGDDLGFLSINGAFVNFSRDENVTAEIIGTYDSVTLLVSRNEIVQTLTLQNGSIWIYGNADADEARLWQTSADRITIVDTGDADAAILINMTRCTRITGSRT